MNPNVVLAVMSSAPREVLARTTASAAAHAATAVVLVAPGTAAERVDPGQRDLPTAVVERRWSGHASTRTALLEAAGEESDAEWALVLDAGMTIAGELPPLDPGVDSYDVVVEDRSPSHRWRWMRAGHLVRTRRGHRWVGIGASGLHEVLVLADGSRSEEWRGLVASGSPSSKAGGGGRSYEDDAARIAEALAAQEEPRARFYHAQSLKDAGRHAEAYAAFVARAGMAGAREETFWARLWAAKLAVHHLDRPRDEALAHVDAAKDMFPDRAEPWIELAVARRKWGDQDGAVGAALEAYAKPYPLAARLFVDVSCYSRRALVEAGVS